MSEYLEACFAVLGDAVPFALCLEKDEWVTVEILRFKFAIRHENAGSPNELEYLLRDAYSRLAYHLIQRTK